MKKFFYGSLLAAAIAPLLAGCVDNSYDLSDIDTTVGVTVENLVVPINLDEITLGNIITLDSESKIKIVDGQYMFLHEGAFNTDPVNIPAIHLKAPTINPSITTVRLINNPVAPLADALPSSFSYDIANSGSTFVYHSTFVSDFIVKIDHIGCRLSLDLMISMSGLEGIANRVTFSDVVLQLPKGLDLIETEGGSYDPTSGELKLPSRTVTGNTLSLKLVADGIDFNLTDGVYDYDGSEMTVSGALYIKEGRATIALDDIASGAAGSLPAEITLRTDYKVSDADVTSFTGSIRYVIDGTNLADIDLRNLPDVFAQSSTDLTFVNPMVYLQITNPLQPFNLYARTGVEIDAYHGSEMSSYSLDTPWFQIGPDRPDGIYNFCLSPTEPANPAPEFMSLTHVAFTEMRNVLSGNGIPDRLEINLTNPNVPTQKVDRLPLGVSLGSLHCAYRFVAPLQFADGSQIVYNHVINGWSSEDLDYLVINRLEVELDISTDLPVGVKFTGYPIDSEGNRIANVSIIGADIDSMADNQHVVIYITGEIRHLDGIVFEAHATATEGATLSPEMTVRLTNIRPKVSGHYEKEL